MLSQRIIWKIQNSIRVNIQFSPNFKECHRKSSSWPFSISSLKPSPSFAQAILWPRDTRTEIWRTLRQETCSRSSSTALMASDSLDKYLKLQYQTFYFDAFSRCYSVVFLHQVLQPLLHFYEIISSSSRNFNKSLWHFLFAVLQE